MGARATKLSRYIELLTGCILSIVFTVPLLRLADIGRYNLSGGDGTPKSSFSTYAR